MEQFQVPHDPDFDAPAPRPQTFFDSMTPRLAFGIGLGLAIGAIGTIGFVWLIVLLF